MVELQELPVNENEQQKKINKNKKNQAMRVELLRMNIGSFINHLKSLGYRVNSSKEKNILETSKSKNERNLIYFKTLLRNISRDISSNNRNRNKIIQQVINKRINNKKPNEFAEEENIRKQAMKTKENYAQKTKLENFLTNLKNDKNIPIETILEYAGKLGYEVTSNSLSELRGKVQTKNLQRPNQNKIKTSFIKLINKKIANIDKQKKLTEIKKNIENNNLPNVLNTIYKAGYTKLDVVAKNTILGYLNNKKYNSLKNALEKMKNNINIKNESVKKIIKNRIETIIKKIPPPLPPRPVKTQNNSTQNVKKQNNSKTVNPPPTQSANPPPTQSANPPPTQSVNPPPGPKGNFAVVFNNGKPTNLKVKMNRPKPGVFTILSPPGTAKTLNLVMRNGFIMIVKKKGA
jgi:hypothetical protein